MRPFLLGDERGAVTADYAIVVSGLAVIGILCLYKVVGWADVMVGGVGASSTEYAALAPDVSDVTEADFRSAMRDTSGN